ncbi:MAG: 2-oxo acid dehydrogenase subunit E2 [Calditrichaeota bacterium]|nr:2-oxo acid dehydrogenase subunit E2 [Candidatus Cloacimonadota bacterium]MCA9786477.1 2-oxo acid dehydrogenase subunit E2 [Candidatus Cloacimonadota bacterium]MCB1048094.1 2-oxo acid dehydrogenase subunit E2 [Calditrichota bacterium]MCB9472373.1 2-oxo acid dehydrogenase subunit E2 [Candidatus Delongbacteria bacterium]
MPYIFHFPDIGEGIAEGKILEWYVKVGQTVKEGDLVVKVETDKVVADIPIPRNGTVLKLIGEVDQVINVEDELVVLQLEGESAAPVAEQPAAAPAPAAKESAGEESFGVVGTIEVDNTGDVMPAGTEGRAATGSPEPTRVRATPAARVLARELGVTLPGLAGSGPDGRILKTDIQRAADSPSGRTVPAAAPVAAASPGALRAADSGPAVTEHPLSQIRKTIAARMSQSKFTAPHATTFEEVEISRLVALRAEQKEGLAAEGIKLSYMPFIFRATALALMANPTLNARLDLAGNRVIHHHFVNLGLAVDTADGLVVPVIRNAHQLSIRELALQIDSFAQRSRERKLTLDELRDGTFTVTNYGAIAGIHGCPIINYPEVAILGIGRILDTPVVRDGACVPGKVLPLSLSVDHRIVDGGDAARFLRDLMALLANPVSMLL